jgi:membrane-associated phospholipid phosphatase
LFKFILAASLGIVWVSPVQAQSLSVSAIAYMPSVGARHALAMLADEAPLELVITHWPQPANAVHDALNRLKASTDKPLSQHLQQALALVQAELEMTQRGSLRANVRNSAEGFVGFGDDYTPGSSVQFESPVWLAGSEEGIRVSGRIAARLEANANPMIGHASGVGGNSSVQARLTNSGLIATLGGVNVQMFSHNTWWSPGWQSSLLASNNVPAWNAIGLQRAQSGRSESPWLRWLGPWSYEWFVAQAQDPKVVNTNQPTGYLYTGMRITAKPMPWMEVAASQMVQSAGSGHYGGLSAYLHGLAGIGSNADTAAQALKDPGNSLSGFDLRLSCGPLGLRCAAYGQLMGEDASSAGLGLPIPYKYLTLGGVETWSADGRHRWFLEYADTHCRVRGDPNAGKYPVGNSGCAYRNSQYPQGETNATLWQGSSFGPDSAMTTLGWYDAQDRRLIKLQRGQIGTSVGSYNPMLTNLPGGDTWGASVKQTLDWAGVRWTPEASYMHLNAGQSQGNYRNSDLRIGIAASVPLFEPSRTAANGLFGASDSQYSLFSDLSLGAKQVTQRALSPDALPSWGWTLGGILAAHALDNRVDKWAVNHPNGVYKTAGKLGSNIPLLVAGGVGLLGLGVMGEDNAQLAGVAATASVLALVGNTGLKYLVGRARPELNAGDTTFNNFNKQSTNSSFASTHTAVAFALLTPYAQANDMPWLYGLGALTAVGRIQERQHWLSDTVAGAAMGYGISSARMTARGKSRTSASKASEPDILVLPNQVQVAWSYY